MPFTFQEEEGSPKRKLSSVGVAAMWCVGAFIGFALVAVCIGLVFLVGAVSRYQDRADAKNAVIVARRNVGIATLKAKARYNESIGIRKAQDEIRKTLTPLYVGFEMTQALQAIATSGKNNSVIYIPTNPSTGLPLVPTTNTLPAKTK